METDKYADIGCGASRSLVCRALVASQASQSEETTQNVCRWIVLCKWILFYLACDQDPPDISPDCTLSSPPTGTAPFAYETTATYTCSHCLCAMASHTVDAKCYGFPVYWYFPTATWACPSCRKCPCKCCDRGRMMISTCSCLLFYSCNTRILAQHKSVRRSSCWHNLQLGHMRMHWHKSCQCKQHRVSAW